MDGASLIDSGMAFQMKLREVDHWISMMERLIHEGMPDGLKTEHCKLIDDL